MVTAVVGPSTTTNGSSFSKNPHGSKAAVTTTSHNRVEGTFCLPIVYGSIAFYLGKQAADECTHRWTLYVRGPNGDEDLSCVIRKVIFQLHPSFPHPIREVTSPPFELTEKGWGEFEAGIRILWNEPSSEQPISITHGIKLYPPIILPPPQTGSSANNNNHNNNNNNNTSNTTNNVSSTVPLLPTPSKEPVLSEFYDEIVFTDPTEAFYQQLQRAEIMPKVTITNTECAPYWKRPSDDNDIKALLAAQDFLDQELLLVKERILKAEEEKVQLEDQIRTVTAQTQAATAGTKVYYPHPPSAVGATATTTTMTTTAIPLPTPSTAPMIPSTVTTATSTTTTATTTAANVNNHKRMVPNHYTVTSAATLTAGSTLSRGTMQTGVGITAPLKLPTPNTTSHSTYEAREAIGGKLAPIKGKKGKATASSSSSSASAKRSKVITTGIKQSDSAMM